MKTGTYAQQKTGAIELQVTFLCLEQKQFCQIGPGEIIF
jgi:hypothetical protein